MPLIDYEKLPQPLAVGDVITALGDPPINLVYLAQVAAELEKFLNNSNRSPRAQNNFMNMFFASAIKHFNLTEEQPPKLTQLFNRAKALQAEADEQEKTIVINNLIEIRELIAAPFLTQEKFNEWLKNNFEYAETIKNFSDKFKEILNAHPSAATQYQEAVIGKAGTKKRRGHTVIAHRQGLFNSKEDLPQRSKRYNETGNQEDLMHEFLTKHPTICAFLRNHLDKIMACGRKYKLDNSTTLSEVDKEFNDLYEDFLEVTTKLASKKILDSPERDLVTNYAKRLMDFFLTLNSDNSLYRSTQTLINQLLQKFSEYDDVVNKEYDDQLSNLKALLFPPIQRNPSPITTPHSQRPRSLTR